MNQPNENWKPVPGFEGRYEVSDQGRIKSLARYIKPGVGSTPRQIKERILKQQLHKGYWRVTLSRDGEQPIFETHRLVARAFIGPCPEGKEVCHGPLGSTVNTVNNLSYGTKRKNNLDDKRRDGSDNRGAKAYQSKLDEAKVLELRALRAQGWKYADLAAHTGVHRITVHDAVNGRTWKHLNHLTAKPHASATSPSIARSRPLGGVPKSSAL